MIFKALQNMHSFLRTVLTFNACGHTSTVDLQAVLAYESPHSKSSYIQSFFCDQASDRILKFRLIGAQT